MPALVFSYRRFSSPQQAAGDSIRRQMEATADWCKRNKATLDTSLNLTDAGVSAFKGKHRENPDVHGLAAFLNAVKTGRVPAGSTLVVENLDRLSRESIVPAVNLFTGILLAGVRIVQLKPTEQTFDAGADMTSIMLALVELSRGNSESRMKSERVGAAWANKRKHAGERIVTKRLPGWVKYEDNKLLLDPTGAATVRRIFSLALRGNGVHAIAVALNADDVPVMGRTVYKGRPVRWNETVVYHVLRSTATYGEYQPHKGRGRDRTPVGDPVANYYPAAIDRDTFHAAQSALKSRTKRGSGRRGKHINLFSGLLVDARDGGSLTYKHVHNRQAAIIPVGAKQGKGTVWSSFPAAPLERALRSRLREVKSSDITGDDAAAKRVESLSAQLIEMQAVREAWEAKMGAMKDPDAVDRVAAFLEKHLPQERQLAEQLADAQRDAASPVSEAWGEYRTLAGMDPDKDTDELRLKIRAALRRSVESIHALFIGAGRLRLALAQVRFRGGAVRSYLVSYDPGRSNRHVKRQGTHRAWSFVEAGLPETFDLRQRGDVSALEKLLNKLDVAKL